MKLFSLALIILAIITGCSTANKSATLPVTELQPPKMAFWPINNQLVGDKDFASIDLFLERSALENPERNTIWWVNYRQAQLWQIKDKNKSCEKYVSLATDPSFPLKRLAYLHANEICPPQHPAYIQVENFDMNQFEPWLNEPVISVALKKAKAKNDYQTLVDLNLKKSKMNLRKEEKVHYADEALKYARKLNDSKKIRELKSRIYNLSPSRKPWPKTEELIGVASDYRYLRNFKKSEEIYNKIINSKKTSISDKIQALRGLRAIAKVEQDKIRTVRTTQDLADFVTRIYKRSKKTAIDAKLYTDTHLLLVRTYWTEGQTTNANKALNIIEKTLAGKFSLADVYWLRGRMEEEKQNYAGASEKFKLALKEPIDSQSFKDKIMWYLAWNEYKQNNFKETIALLSEIKSRTENNYERARISFWLAKSYAAANEKSDAKNEYRELIKEDPLSFYGLAAHRELEEPLPRKIGPSALTPDADQAPPLSRHLRELVNETYLEWLLATKETQVARDYLDTIAQTLKKKYSDDADSWTSLFHLYARSDNYIALFAQLNDLDSSMRRTILEDNMRIVFPNPYYSTVAQAASRFGISTEFIYSIMRQESSFNPQARSHMDAFGLMQLLPEVAKISAKENSIDYLKPDDLYEPHINIPLGSAHLRTLWDKYNGEPILAIASYNASEKAISNWLATRYRGDALEFIEDIPYDETRDYVKLVLRNLINYKILGTNEEQLAFPEWALKISYQKEVQDQKIDDSTTVTRSPAATSSRKKR
ncbi:MAG: transglycosylase SLT domain-containing protein [Bdellovibrionales bacterium]|nr:transglycosylase SLT domain-containing protein [Bdellovibrionales bacterium]